MSPRTARRQRHGTPRRHPTRAVVVTVLGVALGVLAAALVALSRAGAGAGATAGSGTPLLPPTAARTGYHSRATPDGGLTTRSYSAASLRQGTAATPGTDQASRWRPILAAIDARRARAWRSGNPALLRRVYVARARVWQRDRAMLEQYAARGLRVDGVRLGFLSVEVLAQRPGWAALVVVDRLGRATAVGPHGARLDLPTDRPSRHRVTLRRTAAGWRIAAVSGW